MERARVR